MSARPIADNVLQPFQLERSSLRGRLVRLGDTVDTVLTRHDYPEAVSRLLGELLVMAATLAGALKFDGVFSVQTKGDGPISMMVADCTNDGALRAYASYDAERLAAADGTSAADLLGKGYLALTVDQRPFAELYQGIVELTGSTITDSVQAYFRNSEQLLTGVSLAVDRVATARGPRWRAGGLMVQRLPGEELNLDAPWQEEDWHRTMVLLGTATSAELTDPGLPVESLLYRLFHEEGVRLFERANLAAGCRCSRERIETVLRSFPAEELADMRRDDGSIAATCQFCTATYVFDDDDLRGMRDPVVH